MPQVGWTVVYFLVYNLFDIVLKTEFTEPTDFLWQLFFGASPALNPTMWFQVVLIWMTVLFFLIAKVFPKAWINPILIALSGGVLVFEYTGFLMLFDSLRFELKYTIARMVTMIPLASIGYLVGGNTLVTRVRKNRLIAFLLVIILLVLDYLFGIFQPVKGFGSTGLQPCFVAVAFIVLVECIPFECVGKRLKIMIKTASRYTLGVYCIHRMIGTILDSIINHWELPVTPDTFAECIVIYVISYLVCMIGYRLLKKTMLRMMFN